LEGKASSDCCQQYIIIDPRTARFYSLWQFIFTVAIFFELFIVPFFCVCLLVFKTPYWGHDEIIGKKSPIYVLDLCLDIVWIISIFTKFITAIYNQEKREKDWKILMREYIFKGLFIADLLSLAPRFYPHKEEFYFLKLLRLLRFTEFQKNFDMFMNSLLVKINLKNGSKQTNQKVTFFCIFIVDLLFVIHIFACGWLYYGMRDGEGATTWMKEVPDGHPDIYSKPLFTKFICAFYWVTATLTTVGYGDYLGKSVNEYLYTMVVEFFGFIVFGIIMTLMNNTVATDSGQSNDITQVMERVDLWLVALDRLKSSKPIPKLLYTNIKEYIET
jgi:hypothetical protein